MPLTKLHSHPYLQGQGQRNNRLYLRQLQPPAIANSRGVRRIIWIKSDREYQVKGVGLQRRPDSSRASFNTAPISEGSRAM